MIVQIVRFRTELSEQEVLDISKSLENEYQMMPRTEHKYCVKVGRDNHYAGLWFWENLKALTHFRSSSLSDKIVQRYNLKEPPIMEILDSIYQMPTSVGE